MPPDPQNPEVPAWAQGLPAEDVSYITEQGWKGPGDVLKAYRERAAATDPWAGLEPELIEGLVKAKKWEKPADAVRSYAGAQKLLGKPADELVHIPKAGLTPEMRAELRRRVMGPPENPDGYDFGELKDDEGGPQLLGWWKGVAKKLDLGVEEARAIAEEFAAFGAQNEQGSVEQTAAQQQAAVEALQKRHGKEFAALRDAGAHALAILGISDPKSGEASELELMLQAAMGPERFFDTFAGLGKRLGEYKVVEPGGGAGSAASVKAEIDAIRADKSGPYWVKDHPGHRAAVDRMNALYEKLYGDSPAFGPGAE